MTDGDSLPVEDDVAIAMVAAAAKYAELFPLLAFEVDGGGWWLLTDEFAGELAATFPAVDVDAECRKAWAWVDASPRRRKTARGMKRFLVGWVGRASTW